MPPSIRISFSYHSSIPNDSSYAYYSPFSSILELYLNLAQLAMCEVSFSPIFLLDRFIVMSKLSIISSFHRLFQVWHWRKTDTSISCKWLKLTQRREIALDRERSFAGEGSNDGRSECAIAIYSIYSIAAS